MSYPKFYNFHNDPINLMSAWGAGLPEIINKLCWITDSTLTGDSIKVAYSVPGVSIGNIFQV